MKRRKKAKRKVQKRKPAARKEVKHARAFLQGFGKTYTQLNAKDKAMFHRMYDVKPAEMS